jgi:putative nucleotidyltransferase with HDIG domain
MTHVSIEKVLSDVRQLPSLSVVVRELLESFEGESANIARLASKINRDQGLAARVLRVANSAFYGFPGRIGSINEAVVVLGFHAVRSLALASGIISQFSPTEGRTFDRLAFWQHAIGTGVAARVLANVVGRNTEEAFAAGLLHDVGKLVLDAHFHDDFGAVLNYLKDHDVTMLEAEKTVLGLDHAAIGYEVARQWRFPAPIQEAIRDHQHPDLQAPCLLTDIVHVANVLTHALDIGNGGDDIVPLLSEAAWQRLGIPWEDLGVLLKEIERQNMGANLLLSES